MTLENYQDGVTAEFVWEQCLEFLRKDTNTPSSFINSSLATAKVEVADLQLVIKARQNSQKIIEDYSETLDQILTKVCEKLDIETLDLQIFSSDDAEVLPLGLKGDDGAPEQKSLDSQTFFSSSRQPDLKPNFTFDNFVPGKSTKLPMQTCRAVAESPGQSYSPLFLYGDVGLGKTHLLHAIGHYVREHYPKYKYHYATMEKFMNDYVDSIHPTRGGKDFQRRGEDFRTKYRNLDVLLLDDIQFLAKWEATKDELFNTINELDMSGKQIVFAADRPPGELEDIPDRLVSRFASGLVIDIRPPDLETRIAILQLKTKNQAKKNIEIADEAYQYVAENFSSNIRDLEGALNRIIAYASLDSSIKKTKKSGIYISYLYAQEVLKDLVGDTDSALLTPPVILNISAKYLRCRVEDLVGTRRTKQIVAARHVSMYVMREVADLSYPQIGEIFGGKDHTTVIHATKKIEEKMQEDSILYNQVHELSRMLKTGDRKLLDQDDEKQQKAGAA